MQLSLKLSLCCRDMKIDLLYFDGCPLWQKGPENLRAALVSEGTQAIIRLVGMEIDAETERFHS